MSILIKPEQRSELTKEQTGKESTSEEWFYLFELGHPLSLQQPIVDFPVVGFQRNMVLSTLTKLNASTAFNKEELAVYTAALR